MIFHLRGHDRSRFDRGRECRQNQALLRRRAGAARIQLTEGREIAIGLRAHEHKKGPVVKIGRAVATRL
jgi:hypothetical protein